MAEFAGLSQFLPQGFLGGGLNFNDQSQKQKQIRQQFDFSKYEPGFREYQKQNPLGLDAVGLAAVELPGGLTLNNTGEFKQFSDYMQSIGDDYYNQYDDALRPFALIGLGTPTPTPAPVAQTPLPSTQPSVSMQSTGASIMTPELASQMSMTRDVKAPEIQNAINQAMQTGQSVSYNDPRVLGTALPMTSAISASTQAAPAPVAVSTRAPVMQAPTPAPVAQTPLPITQTGVNVQNTGNTKMATDTTVTSTGLDQFAQPYAEYGLAEALRQYQAGAPAYYPGQTYTEFAPQTEQALRAAEQRALAGSPLVSGAQKFAQTAMSGGFGSPAMQYAQGLAGGVDLSEPMGMIRQTAQGGFLGGSPGLQAAIERATRPAQASAMSSLASRGRLGSGLGSQAVAQAVGDVAANISYQDYNRERQNQIAAQQTLADMMRAQYGSALQGAGFLGDVYQQDYARRAGAATAAPGLAELDYGDISRLANVGAAREAQAQRAIDDAMARYQYEQTAPQQQLGTYLGQVYRFPGQQSTTVTPLYEPSTGQQFLGGALIGSQIYKDNPLVGAGIGGLLGFL